MMVLVTLVLFVYVALFLDWQNAAKSHSASKLVVLFRILMDSRNAFGTTAPEDVKFAVQGDVSCQLSLVAHSDRILSQVKEPRAMMYSFVPDIGQRLRLIKELAVVEKKTRTQCLSRRVNYTLHTDIMPSYKLPTDLFFNLAHTPQSLSVVCRGMLDQACRVCKPKRSRKIFLRNMTITSIRTDTRMNDDPEGDIELLLSFGTKDLIMNVTNDAMISIYALVSCVNTDKILPNYISVRKRIPVGLVRKLLRHAEQGVSTRQATSFMTVGLHSRTFGDGFQE